MIKLFGIAGATMVLTDPVQNTKALVKETIAEGHIHQGLILKTNPIRNL